MQPSTFNLELINGHRLYVERCGSKDGPVVVLLHHGLGSTYSWQYQVPAFAEAGYRVIAYDRWGYGKSDARKQLCVPYFVDDLQDLETMLDLYEVDNVTLIGHSDGGTIALYYSAKHRERVLSLVTVAAHIYLEPKMAPGIEGIRISYETDQRFREGLRRIHGANADRVFRNWYDAWLKPDNLKWDMRPTLAEIVCPTLVIQGKEDEHATPKHAEDIAASICNAELWLAPRTKHMLPQEVPEEFNRRVMEFITNKTKDGRRKTMDERTRMED